MAAADLSKRHGKRSEVCTGRKKCGVQRGVERKPVGDFHDETGESRITFPRLEKCEAIERIAARRAGGSRECSRNRSVGVVWNIGANAARRWYTERSVAERAIRGLDRRWNRTSYCSRCRRKKRAGVPGRPST